MYILRGEGYMLNADNVNSRGIAMPVWWHHYYTDNDVEDKITKDMIKDILEIVTIFDYPLFADERGKKFMIKTWMVFHDW